MNDTELTTLMREATDRLQPDVAALVAGGTARGVRKRRRRNAGVAVGGLVLAGAVVAGALAGGGPGGSAAIDPAAPSTSATTPPSDGEGVEQGLRARVTVPAGETSRVLASLVEQVDPSGGRAREQESTHGNTPVGPGRPSWQAGRVAWRDGLVQVGLSWTGAEGSAQQLCEDAAPGRSTCREVAPGDWLSTWSSRADAGVDASVSGRHADLFTHDGYTVEVGAFGSPAGATGTAGDPVLTADQAVAIATSEVWFD